MVAVERPQERRGRVGVGLRLGGGSGLRRGSPGRSFAAAAGPSCRRRGVRAAGAAFEDVVAAFGAAFVAAFGAAFAPAFDALFAAVPPVALLDARVRGVARGGRALGGGHVVGEPGRARSGRQRRVAAGGLGRSTVNHTAHTASMATRAMRKGRLIWLTAHPSDAAPGT